MTEKNLPLKDEDPSGGEEEEGVATKRSLFSRKVTVAGGSFHWNGRYWGLPAGAWLAAGAGRATIVLPDSCTTPNRAQAQVASCSRPDGRQSAVSAPQCQLSSRRADCSSAVFFWATAMSSRLGPDSSPDVASLIW